MPNKMERFTQQSRRVLSLAEEETRQFQHTAIGPQHLLIALMREEDSIAGRTLRELGLDPGQVRELVKQMTPLKQSGAKERLDLSDAAKKVLELSIDEARRMGHHYIGTEHLLLGVVRQSDNIAVDILKRLNVSPEDVRSQARKMIDIPAEAASANDIQATIDAWNSAIFVTGAPATDSPEQSSLTDHFTSHAQSVVSLAYAEAARLQASSVGPEHLLLALVILPGGVARRILNDMGIKARDVQIGVARLSEKQKGEENRRPQPNEHFQKALELALDEGRLLDHRTIRTEHLILGLIRQGESPAIDILKQLNVSPETLRNATLQVMNDPVAVGEVDQQDFISTTRSDTQEQSTFKKMERFTQRARRALSLALEEAERLQHDYIGPEHLLLGLLQDDGGIAYRVLNNLGLEISHVREMIQDLTRDSVGVKMDRFDLTDVAKHGLVLAVDEARSLGHQYIGTEHLLLGLSYLSVGVVVDVLKQLDISQETIRIQTHRVIQGLPIDVPVKAKPQPQRITEHFTRYAKEVLALAAAQARELNAAKVGTEHLLLALILHQGGMARKVLRVMGLEEGTLKNEVAKLSENQTREEGVPLQYDEPTVQALQLAVDYGYRAGLHYIGTEHLLIGLLLQSESAAIDILKRLDISVEEMHQQLERIMQEAPPVAKPPKVITTGDIIETRRYQSSQPTQKMERFTQRARRVLSLAQEEAERLQHSYIGTEHMLLGLMREEGGVAGRVLRDLGLDVHRMEELVDRLTRGGQRTQNARLDLTPGTKKVLELAVDEARRMGHHYIGTEHLLLGLVRQSDGVAIDVLKRLNVSSEEVRRQTRRVMQESPVQGRGPAAPPDLPQKAPRIPRFTPSARRMLSEAQMQAEQFQHQFIGVQHLLGALIRDENGIAAVVLRNKGVTPEAVDYLIKQVPPMQPYGGPLDLDENLKKVLELATEAAIIFDHYDIGMDDLLIGLARQPVGILLLRRLELDPQEIISTTTEMAAEYAPRPEQEGSDVVTSIESELLDPPEPRQQTFVVPRQVESQRFAGEWRITLAIARAEAIRFKSKTIEPEHLLIALLIDEGDRTGKLLRAAGLDLQKLLAAIQVSEVMEPVIEAEMSPKMVEILGFATDASWKSQNYYIQVEHLLLGLLRQKENAALDILRQQNVSLDELEKAARESLG